MDHIYYNETNECLNVPLPPSKPRVEKMILVEKLFIINSNTNGNNGPRFLCVRGPQYKNVTEKDATTLISKSTLPVYIKNVLYRVSQINVSLSHSYANRQKSRAK